MSDAHTDFASIDDANVQDLARLYAGMTPEQVVAHKDWVRRYKAERAIEDAKAVAADAERRAMLRGLDDEKVVFYALQAGIEGYCDKYLPGPALAVLRDAGFVRCSDLAEDAYRAGFEASSEGWNGEHPGDATDDARFVERMQDDIETIHLQHRKAA